MVIGPQLFDAWIGRMGFTNKEAADYLGMHESTVTKWRNGTRIVQTLDLAISLERKTGIPVEAWSDESDTLVMAGARPRRKQQ